MSSVTRAAIVKALRGMGLERGDILVVHSSLSSFGRVRGGAKAVVDALLETIGTDGTLVMPSLPAATGKPYDYRATPTGMGAVAEHFRGKRATARSMCPFVPASALGPRAQEFVQNHHKCRCPYIDSPWDLAALAGGYVLLLGVDQDRNTTLHCAEARARVAYMNPADGEYVDERGRMRRYRGVLYAGPHRNFIAVDPLLRKAGIMKTARIGTCVARLMKGRDLIEFCTDLLRRDAGFVLTKNEGYYDGIMQRGRVRAAGMAGESFTLIARSSAAGRNMEEVLWHAERAGAAGLEVDAVDGRDIVKLSRAELATLLTRIRGRNMEVFTVRSNILTADAFEASLKAAKALGARAVIAPLTGLAGHLKARARAARAAGLRVFFENVAAAHATVREIMQALGGDAALAFNPAHFAAAGELAFLASFRPLKKYVRYVAISDGSLAGAACVPGNGNGEVKEIMSILRCASFDGYFSLGADPAAGVEFDAATDAFHKLLDES